MVKRASHTLTAWLSWRMIFTVLSAQLRNDSFSVPLDSSVPTKRKIDGVELLGF